MRVSCYVLVLMSTLICTACFDPTFAWRVDEQFRKQGLIVISTYTGEGRLNTKSGFYISMRPEDAAKVHAPNGADFHKLLDERVLYEEQILGHKLCQLGYKIVEGHTTNYHGMYIDFDAECND